MKPVRQTIFAPPDGDCMRACVASILELPIDDVPNFPGDGDQWWDAWQDWLKPRNLVLVWMPYHEGHPWKPSGYAIISFEQSNGWGHVCVALDGEVIWNPFPGTTPETPVGKRDWWIIFQTLDAAKAMEQRHEPVSA